MAGDVHRDRRAPTQCQGDGRRATSTSSTSQLNRWETIKKWELLDHDLTVESGELTPSMKVKRNVVEDNYKDAHRRVLRLTSRRSSGRSHVGRACRDTGTAQAYRLEWVSAGDRRHPFAFRSRRS